VSITRTYTVFCDLPKEEHEADRHGVTLCTGWAIETVDGAVEARKLANQQGWRRINGQDLCPYAVKAVEKA
jgi:hypothetical protein